MDYNIRNVTYRKSTEHPSVGVSEEGLLVNLHTKIDIEINPPKEDWYLVFTSPDTGKTTLLHRLVAECWVPNPDTEENPLVNHLNGNKHDPHCRNLEWTSYRGNLLHAYKHGLRTEMQTLEVQDKTTTEWFKSKGLNLTASLIGLSPAQLSYHLKISGWYETKSHIVQLSNLEKRTEKARVSVAGGIFAREIESGTVTIASNVSHLSREIGVPKSNIKRCLEKGKEYPSNGYLFSLDGEFPCEWKKNHRTKMELRFVHSDGRVVTAVSAREAQKLTGINAKRVSRMLNEGGKFRGWELQTHGPLL